MYYFTDDCLIGVEQIDEEHRELFRMIGEIQDLFTNEFLDDKYDQICEMIRRLENYAEEHFRHEEEYMEQINHPELELQKKQHLDFCEKIAEMDAVVGGHDQQEFLADLLAYLVRWLYRHIIGSDLMIGKLVALDEWKKSSCEFTDKHLTGIGTMDEEHKILFGIIQQIHDVIADDSGTDKCDELARLLGELRTCTKIHFTDEEEYMESIRYEGLEAQKVAHEIFAARLDEIDLDAISTRQETDIEGLVASLTEWIVNHVLHMDKKIHQAH